MFDSIFDSYGYSDSMWVGLALGILLFVLAFGIIVYCISAFFMMKLFRKANVEAWKAWVPFVNNWTFLKLGGYPGWIILFAFAGFIPFIGWLGSIAVVVFCCMAAHQIGLKLHKDGVWVVLFIFVSIVWMGICGLDRSTWDDRLGRPSLIPGTPSSGGYAYATAGTAYQQPGSYQQPGGYQQPGAYPPQNTPNQQPGSYQQPGNPPSGGNPNPPYPPNGPTSQ
ncbi:MAG: DUF5684 domain-containing protein [Coriobacteriales bacterium]|jgi:hypothetical protein|nr:DUF5684 domain-containing protein [Coriobacteriales bacterium]